MEPTSEEVINAIIQDVDTDKVSFAMTMYHPSSDKNYHDIILVLIKYLVLCRMEE